MLDRCKENVIEWIENEQVATVTLSQKRHITKIKKLAAEHPEDVQIVHENMDGSVLVHIPVSYIKFIAPRNLSDEEKEKLIERLKKIVLIFPHDRA